MKIIRILTAIFAISNFSLSPTFGASNVQSTPTLATLQELKDLVTRNQLLVSVSKEGRITVSCLCGPRVTLDQISKYVPMALVAIEDKRFFDHRGSDPLSIGRAFLIDLFSWSHAQGGSTIEQQLCKNRVLSSASNIRRKFADKACAENLDRVMSKNQILESYLNGVYWGEDDNGVSIYGIEQAARVYFGRSAADLTFQQSCVLVGMLKGPHHYDPRTHLEAAMKRAELIAREVLAQGFLTMAQAKKAMHENGKVSYIPPVEFEHRYYADWVMKQLRKSGVTLIDGMHIPIYLDVMAQSAEQAAFTKAVDKFHVEEGADRAFVTMTPDGHVTAMGGEDDYGKKQFNAAADGKVAAASTFKLVTYLSALEKGYPAQGNIYDGAKEGEDWNPAFLQHAQGRVSVVTAFAHSLNIPAIRLFRYAGVKAVIATARRLGITAALREDETLALGGSEVSILEMTGAYAVFANGGFRVEPRGFLGVSDSDGMVRYWMKSEKVRVVAPKSVSAMRINLRHVVTEGTGVSAQDVPDAMGKTGTQVDNSGAWFIGFTKEQVTTVWIGRPPRSVNPLPVAGHDMSDIWAAVMAAITKK